MVEPPHLKTAGAQWWHSEDHHSPSLTKASLGEFFYAVLSAGGHIGEVWPFNPSFRGSAVYVSVFMTVAMKDDVESKTRFRFREPPKVGV